MTDRRLPVLLLTLLTLPLLAAVAFAHRDATPAPDSPPAPRYGFEVVVAAAGTPGSYRMDASVRDLDGGMLLANPRVVLAAGSKARASELLEGTDHAATVDVTVAEDGRSAELVLQVVADHRSLSYARAIIELPDR